MKTPLPFHPSVHLTIRPVRPEDEPYLRELRAEVDSERLMLDELAIEEELKNRLLDHQFEAHRQHYREADWDRVECLIEMELSPVGAFIVMQSGEEIRLADMAVQKSHRGLGIGFAVIQTIRRESEASGRPIRLHVERANPALAWYEQIGFRPLEDRGTHLFLEWPLPKAGEKTFYFPGT